MPAAFLETATQLAYQAGELLREGYTQAKHIKFKGVVDLVTEFDHKSEALILGGLRAAFPDHALLAEESGANANTSEYQWIVDPLDGTVNFAHGFPVFCVSIALARQRQVIAGVVYDPLRDELFAAEAGQGATLNGEPMQVTDEAQLERALLATGFPYDVRTNPNPNFAQFERFYKASRAVRRAGSAALDSAWVAAGRLEGYWEYHIKPWDIAAGALLVREAGGLVTTCEGNPDFLGVGSILATNGKVHAEMLRILESKA